MEKDKVESRTAQFQCRQCDGLFYTRPEFEAHTHATRPSVPQQGQAQILPCQMVQDKFHVYIGAHELRDFCGTRDEAEVKVKEIGISESAMAEQWFNANPEILRQFGFNKNHRAVIDVMEAYATFRLAASHSEEATAQDVFYCGKCGQSLDKEDVVLDAALARIKELEAGAPAATPQKLVEAHLHECAKAELLEDYDSDYKFNVSFSWVTRKMARFAAKYGNVTIESGAPAAGSTELLEAATELLAMWNGNHIHSHFPIEEDFTRAAFDKLRTALAGTDTDVAKGES